LIPNVINVSKGLRLNSFKYGICWFLTIGVWLPFCVEVDCVVSFALAEEVTEVIGDDANNVPVDQDENQVNKIRQHVMYVELPAIAEDPAENKPYSLVDLSEIAEVTDQIQSELFLSPDQQDVFVIVRDDQDQSPVWKIDRGDSRKKLDKHIAEISVPDQELIFTWNVTSASEKDHRKLQNAMIKITLSDECVLNVVLRRPIESSDFVYDAAAKKGHEIIHAHPTRVELLADSTRLQVKDINPKSFLGKVPDKDHTAKINKWIVVKKVVNQRLDIKMKWKARLIQAKSDDKQGVLEVRQVYEYDLAGGKKGLPLSNGQVKKHLKKLNEQIVKQRAFIRKTNANLRTLNGIAARLAGAKRGSKEWAEAGVVRNQIAGLIPRNKAAARRIKNASRDQQALQDIGGVIRALDKRPIAYRVKHDFKKYPVSLLQSASWGPLNIVDANPVELDLAADAKDPDDDNTLSTTRVKELLKKLSKDEVKELFGSPDKKIDSDKWAYPLRCVNRETNEIFLQAVLTFGEDGRVSSIGFED